MNESDEIGSECNESPKHDVVADENGAAMWKRGRRGIGRESERTARGVCV